MLIFIEYHSHCFSEIKPERNFHSHEASSSTNDYCRQHDTSYYQPVNYNQLQQHFHYRTIQIAPYRTGYDMEEV